jgi:hypothetical protein
VFDEAKDLDIHPFVLINFFIEKISYDAGSTISDPELVITITPKKIGEVIEDVFPTDPHDPAGD